MLKEFHIGTKITAAVSDPERARILRALAGGEVSAENLATSFTGSRDQLLHHLEILREATLISSRSDGLTLYYRIAPESAGILKNLTA